MITLPFLLLACSLVAGISFAFGFRWGYQVGDEIGFETGCEFAELDNNLTWTLTDAGTAAAGADLVELSIHESLTHSKV